MVQFKHVLSNLYKRSFRSDIDQVMNELVTHVQPDEAIYFQIDDKFPNLSMHLNHSNLHLHYATQYQSPLLFTLWPPPNSRDIGSLCSKMRTQRSIVDIFLLVMVQSMYVRNKSSLGDMHTSKRKNKGHKILHGSAKAYIHEAHPHSTHTMKSIITIVKNYLSQLSQFSHFSTWHSTPLVDMLQWKL